MIEYGRMAFAFILFLRRSETFFDNLPVDDIPNRINIVGSNIAIIYIVRMFPNINALFVDENEKTKQKNAIESRM
jgi:hypothetical protein